MKRSYALAVAFTLTTFAFPALAQEIKAGDLTIAKPWARATPKGADIGAGYLEIRNAAATPDRLTGGSSDFAGGVEVHQMSMDNGVMKMREMKDGLEIPAHGSVKLSPNGHHLMFIGLKHPLVKGQTIQATLNFEHAGAVMVAFPVQGVGAPAPAAPKGDDMTGMKM